MHFIICEIIILKRNHIHLYFVTLCCIFLSLLNCSSCLKFLCHWCLYIRILYLILFATYLSGVEKREDHTSSVGDLLRDIETALDTVLDEREKQLQQQVSHTSFSAHCSFSLLFFIDCSIIFPFFIRMQFSFFFDECRWFTLSCFLYYS